MDREKSFSVCKSFFRYQWGFDMDMEIYKMRHQSSMDDLKNIKHQFILNSDGMFINGMVSSANFSRNGDLLAASYYRSGHLSIWDWQQNKLKTQLSTSDISLSHVNWMPGSQDLVTCSGDGVISLLDLHRNYPSRQFSPADLRPHFGSYHICVDHERPYQIFALHSRGALFVFDLRTNQTSLGVALEDKKSLVDISSCALNPSFPSEFCVGSYGKARIYDFRNLREYRASFTWPVNSELHNTSQPFLEIKYSYNGKQILASSLREAVYVFETPFENEHSKFQLPNTQPYWSKINFIGSRSEFIVVGTLDERKNSAILIWDKSKSKLLCRKSFTQKTCWLETVHPYFNALALAVNEGGIEIWQ